MERVPRETGSILDENVGRLAELWPDVVTEVREPDGTLRHTVDVDALRERVGDVAEGLRERYQFTWPGKREAKQEAYRPIDKCLRPCPEESVGWDSTRNLYIEGDNLDALKLLRNTYAGRVKMIYIDPPYNTGHDFIYDDDFAKARADYDAESGDYSEWGGASRGEPREQRPLSLRLVFDDVSAPYSSARHAQRRWGDIHLHRRQREYESSKNLR